jgi:hypothetical protein
MKLHHCGLATDGITGTRLKNELPVLFHALGVKMAGAGTNEKLPLLADVNIPFQLLTSIQRCCSFYTTSPSDWNGKCLRLWVCLLA